MKKKKIIIVVLVLAFILPVLYSMTTKNPVGTNVKGEFYPADHVEFLVDLNYEKDGERIHEHEIFKNQMDLIQNAEEFLLLDIFLFNDEYTKEDLIYPPQVEQMTDLLIQKKKANPNMPIVLITDPINNFYGAYEQKNITRLREVGITVHVTDLNTMRDSNPLVSGPYRAYMQWFGTSGTGYIPNFFDKEGPKVNVRSIIKLANFKGNHRKVYLSEKEAIVSSSNPHDPSSLHSNVALRFSGQAIDDLIQSELALMDNPPEIMTSFQAPEGSGDTRLRVVTESAIYDVFKENIKMMQAGDTIWLGMFYLADFDVLQLLGEASERGVDVRIVADLNKDAFGIEKMGTPNRPALTELVEDYPDITVRFYKTDGEQYHTKMVYFDYAEKEPHILLGSANFTRRNLRDYNLETNVEMVVQKNHPLDKEVDDYFHRIWENQGGLYTEEMDAHREDNLLIRGLWKFQEQFGLCTW